MVKTMKSMRRVNFEDCDPFAHLNNANYLTYFITAREEQLRTYNVLDIFEHVKKTGNGWVVTSHAIRYLRPTRIGEEVEIWSRMLSYDRFRNLVEFVMVSPGEKQLKSVMHTEFAYCSIKQARPVPVDRDTLGLFKEISLIPEQKITEIEMNDRIRAIKTELAALNPLTA